MYYLKPVRPRNELGMNSFLWARYAMLSCKSGIIIVVSQIPKIRQKNYFEAQKILLEEDAVVVPLYYEPNQALVRKRVKGLELNPLNYPYLRKVNLE